MLALRRFPVDTRHITQVFLVFPGANIQKQGIINYDSFEQQTQHKASVHILHHGTTGRKVQLTEVIKVFVSPTAPIDRFTTGNDKD